MSKNNEKPRDALNELPPHSDEAEKALLGCILQASDIVGAALEQGTAPEWFYDLRNRLVWMTLVDMDGTGKPIDMITVYEAMRSSGRSDDVGGLPYLNALDDQKPVPSAWEQYAGVLKEKFVLRRAVQIGTSMADEGMNPMTKADDLLARAEKEVLELSEERTGIAERRVKEVILEVIADLEDYHRGKPQLRGITTGIEYVDKLLCGLGGQNGNYVVISGRPGTGKTSFAMQVAVHAALDFEWEEPVMEPRKGLMAPKMAKDREGKETDRFETIKKRGVPVGIFTMEMKDKALMNRTLFQRAGADMQRWRGGFAAAEDFQRLTKGAAELAKAPIYIDDSGRQTIDSLKAKARRMWRQHGIKLFVIDYIQLMRGGKRWRQDRVQELSEVSGELQNLGKELNVPLIVLAQMNRDYEKDPGRPPRLSDLKDCGSIEQDADLVGFLYTPRLKDKEQEVYDRALEQTTEYTDEFGKPDWSKFPRRVNIIFQKNRYGPDGKAELLFQKSCTRFMDWNVWLKRHGFKEFALGENSETSNTKHKTGNEDGNETTD